MGITFGTVMFGTWIIGLVVSVLVMAIMPSVFAGQKKKLLKQIEEEF